jgi:hypothetical protein
MLDAAQDTRQLLSYAVFDPRPYSELMDILEREVTLRPPTKTMRFRCSPPEHRFVALLAFDTMARSPASAGQFLDLVGLDAVEQALGFPDTIGL